MAKCAFVSAEAAFWSARIAFTFSSGVCMRAVQTGKSILSRHVRQASRAKPRAGERVQPLRAAVIADVGMVAQQFDRLQMRVEQRLARSVDVDERRPPAAFQRAARFPKSGVEVAPVMRGESAGDKVERLVFERESLGWGFRGLDVAQSLLARRPRHRRQHLGRQIRRNDPAGMAREGIGDMAAAGAEIEGELRAQLLRERSDRLEVGPLTVNRAFDIGFRSRAELRLDDSLMGLAHQSLLLSPGLLRLRFKLLQD